MRSVVALAVLELRRFLADRLNLFFVLVLPMVLVVVLGLQSGGGGGTAQVALSGDASTVAALEAELATIDLDTSRHAEAGTVEELVSVGTADVGIVVRSADPLQLDLVVADEQTAAGLGQLVRSAADRVTVARAQEGVLTGAGISPEQAAAALDGAPDGWSAAGVEVGGTDPVMEEFAAMGRFEIGAGGQLLLFVFLNTLTAASAMINARRSGAIRRTMAAPITSTQAVAGLALGRFVIAVFQGAYIMVASSLLFDVRWGALGAVLTVLALFGLVAAGVALVIGVVVDSDGLASGIGVGGGLILAALGGCMVPLEFFPEGLRMVAMATPHGWAYEALAEIQRRGGGVLDVLPQLGVLAAMAAAVLLAGGWLLRRSLERAM
ncbi:ABC transporter permease [Ornithinimicrobium cerasi]|uniref:ABC-2 type transport system permease protein n=1 Tax=Ornithinimicrobium cerasi TaxID=2248773 RepID=A0A285VWF4_9MICO|nr:ABC transporter permease [Ornithinimicrobium cerasi]SOC58293.1 ABC-2 type transport system permease protein [Ornithinimicrobium cerasi]